MELIFIATMMETFIVIILVAIALVVSQIVRNKKRRATSGNVLNNPGIVTRALVLSSEETANNPGNQPIMKLQLQVIPPGGRNFVVEVNEMIGREELHRFQSGTTIMVKYNPHNVKQVSLIRN